ncbi:MAG: 2TM domain-containing protein [Rhodospirillales bacterium]
MTSPNPERPDNPNNARNKARLRGFALHLLGYFAVIIVLGIINFTTTPEDPWVVLPMVGWGSVLALHVAWVMGLLDGLFDGLFGK